MKLTKKKIYKKIITTVTSILMILGFFVINRTEYKALSNVTSSNSYGGYTWQIIDTSFDMDGNVTLSSAQISMNLNGHYNGSFTINISLSTIIDSTGIGYTNTINNYGFICNGCRITTYDSSHLYVAITDCNYWEILIVPVKNATIKNWKSILNALDISSITGWSMTKLDEITATQITTIQTTLTNLNNNTITTNSRLNTTNTELHNIYNAISSGGTYGSIQSQLHIIGVNLSSEIDQTVAIKNKIDSYLSGTIDNETVSIWDLVNDTNYSLDTINNTLNTINSHINDYTSVLNTISSTLTNIDTNLSNIDNKIDTISWITLNNILSLSDTIDGTYSTDSNTNNNEKLFIKLQLNSLRGNTLYRIKTGIYNSNNSSARPTRVTTKVWYYNGSTYSDRSTYQEVIFVDNSGDYLTIYLNTATYVTGSRALIIELDRISTQTGYLRYDKNQSNIKYIQDDDIEYWQLLEYFNQYDMNNKLLQAINNINMSVTNTTIQDTTTNINDYNTIYNQVSNVEQNYINEYNTNNTTLQNIINDKKGIPDNIVNVSTDIESKMGQLFTVPEIKYLFALIISGCVLLALLG